MLFHRAGLLLVGFPYLLTAYSGPPPCEAPSIIRHELGKYDDAGESPSYAAQVAARRTLLRRLLNDYPDSIQVHLRYQQFMAAQGPTEIEVMVGHYQRLLDKRPDDPLYTYLYGLALVGRRSTEAASLFDRALQKDPRFVWPRLALANLYSSGKMENTPQVKNELNAFFNVCPASLDPDALNMLPSFGSPDTVNQVTAAVRDRLAQETDSLMLEAYKPLWNLELLAVSSGEKENVRHRIGDDLKRLSQIPSPARAGWLGFLRAGYRIVEDAGNIKRIDDQLMREFPQSAVTRQAAWAQFIDAHPLPAPMDPKEKKQAFYGAYLQASSEWIRRWPSHAEVWAHRFSAVEQLDPPPQALIQLTADNLLAALQDNPAADAPHPYELRIARLFVKYGIAMDRASELIDRGLAIEEQRRATRQSDLMTAEEEKAGRGQGEYYRLSALETLLELYAKQKHPDRAREAFTRFDRGAPQARELEALYFKSVGHLAEIEGRKLDALTAYQTALQTRPKNYVALGRDDLAEATRVLIKELGGTEDSWRAFVGRRDGTPAWEADGRQPWTKPAKALPAFELPDLAGKVWTAKTLAGKTVIANVWATWCGPCVGEHYLLQKLYDKVKNRSDIALVTFSVDTDANRVSTYMQKNNYTFPVLLAGSTLKDALGTPASIPRNWLIDAGGALQWEQIGFNPNDAEWETKLLTQLEQTKPQTSAHLAIR